MTSNNEEQAKAEAAAQPSKATQGASVVPRERRAAPAKPRSGKDCHLGKGAAQKPKGRQGFKVWRWPLEGSKAAKVLAPLRRPDGATLKELTKATGWQPHSVRGFLSGAVGKKMGLKLESTKAEGSERSYSIKD